MRLGSSWANPKAGNLNFIRAVANQPVQASSPVRVVPPVMPIKASPSGFPPVPVAPSAPGLTQIPSTPVKPFGPQVSQSIASPASQVGAPPVSPVVQPSIAQKIPMGSQVQPRLVGQMQGTMAPRQNTAVIGNPNVRSYKKGGVVTTRKVSTTVKNKSQSKW